MELSYLVWSPFLQVGFLGKFGFTTGEDTIEEIDITEPGIINFDEKKPDFDQIEVSLG